MKKNSLITFLIVLFIGCAQNALAKNQCSKNDEIKLSIFSKNDYKLYSYYCSADEGVYLKNFINNSKKTIFLNEYSDFAANEPPKLLAVSVYKGKSKKPPILIVLSTAYHCCTPQMEGDLYKVNLYQINEKNNAFSLKDITSIFGKNSDGFEGQSEGEFFYKYKDIASIKNWLEKNYR
ncbi:MAG: hypothetical protein RR575_03335 [Acinetobacter sp.]